MAAARALRGGRVWAIDVRAAMLSKVQSDAAAAHIDGITTKEADYQVVGGTTLGAMSLDAVIIPNTLFAAQRKRDMLKEALRILKIDGKLLIVDWKDSYGGMGPQKEHVVTEAEARALAENVGFEFIKDFPSGSQHYGLVYKKPQPQQGRRTTTAPVPTGM